MFDDLRKIIITMIDKFIALSSYRSPFRIVGLLLVVLFVVVTAFYIVGSLGVSNIIDIQSGVSINMEAMMI